MPNHFHLLIETPKANISIFLQNWLTKVTQSMNKKIGRTGHLLQGRTKTLLIETEKYFTTAFMYVLQNRVRAGLEENIFRSKWTSIKELIELDESKLGISKMWEYIFKKKYMVSDMAENRALLKKWLNEYEKSSNQKEFIAAHRGSFLGTSEFRKKILGKLERRNYLNESKGNRRKTDKKQIIIPFKAIEKLIQEELISGNWKGLWRTENIAHKHLLCYILRKEFCLKWDEIYNYDISLKTGREIIMQRLTNNKNKLKIVEKIIKKMNVMNVKE